MAADKMKPLLALSKHEPVQAAFGLTADGEAVILLDKKMKPKGVLAALKSSAAKAKIQLQPSTVRFGRAEVDTEIDSALVRFFINKDPPGSMRPKLIEVVRRAAYQKVEINVDESLEQSPEDESEAGSTEDAAAGDQSGAATAAPIDAEALRRELAALIGRIASAAGNDAARRASLAKLANDANTGLKAQDFAAAMIAIDALRAALDQTGPGEAQTAADPAELDRLRKELAALIPQIAGASGNDASRRVSLLALANEANSKLKAHDGAGATTAIGDLRDALAATAGNDVSAAAPSGTAIETETATNREEDLTEAWRAARAAWDSASAAAGGQMTALAAALRSSEDEDLRQIAQRDLAGIVAAFANQLRTAINGLGDSDGPVFRKAAGKTLSFMERLRTEIADDPRLEACDTNPIGVQVSVAATLGRALNGLTDVLDRAA